jgi:hypothetical protein
MTTTPTSKCNKTMKVKRPREGGFCVIKLFCGGSFFFPLHFYQAPKIFITKNLVITYKLSIIKGFCHKLRDFVTILVFLSFCHSLKGITKEKEEI